MKVPTADLLFEIGAEEIPAGMLARAGRELQGLLEKHLETYGLLSGATVRTFAAPRRLSAEVKAIHLKQADVEREVTGPPKSVAFDSVGAPTKAAESFAAKNNATLKDLRIVTTAKGEYIAVKQIIRGKSALDILREILPAIIAELTWPRTMYWTTADSQRFIRPIRWIVALLGGKVVPFEYGGVKSGASTTGHRFLGKANIPLSGARDYLQKLRINFVLADPAERRKKIEKELASALAGKGMQPHADAALMEKVVYLNEYPAVITGDFDPAYLELPEEILITVMRDHQKYFGVEKKSGGLAPHFLAVINLDKDRAGDVRRGHERVLRARFADARFFWETDQKTKLADHGPKLKTVTYESRLGSYADKTERNRRLARWLAEQWFSAGVSGAHVADADRAAELAKCDLVTEMVREFTELQGIVGGLYAAAQGEGDQVAAAVYDHYQPLGIDDAIPRNLTGCAVALADKLDTLVGCFAVGIVPSGSSDAFALRRAALGVVKIILEKKLPMSLSAAVSAAAKGVTEHPPKIKVTPEAEKQVMDFIVERAKFILKEKLGFAYDEVNAALAVGADDLVDAVKRVEAVKAIRKTKNFEPLAVSFKRIRKIIEKAGPMVEWRNRAVDEALLRDPAEKDLHFAAKRVAGAAIEHKRAGKYREALEAIATLRPTVDRFFDDVMVMDKDDAVKRNRLTLLEDLRREFSTIADFSEIVTTEKSG